MVLMMMMSKTCQKTLLSRISSLVDTQGVERSGQALQSKRKRVCLMIWGRILRHLMVVNACIAGHHGVADHVVAGVVHGDAEVNTGRARIVGQRLS